jgi:hypothetical protein
VLAYVGVRLGGFELVIEGFLNGAVISFEA